MEYNQSSLSINDFEIMKTIGTGTFGRVKLVKLKGNETMPPFALKILRKKLIIKYNQVDHIKSEKQILQQIKFPFIVNFFVSFQDQNFIYFLFEYIPGGELFSLLRHYVRFSTDTIRFYSSQLALTLEYLHSLSIAYRDIKPENILIDRKGNLKLTDFGFAKVVTEKSFTMCGTPEYMAPEVIMHSSGHDCTADWWSFGVLLFEMMQGFPPFFDDNPIIIYQKILIGKYEFQNSSDRALQNLIKNLLRESRKRLGRKNGSKEIEAHKFFKKIKWDDVIRKNITPPWVPEICSKEDTHYFSQYNDTEECSLCGSVDMNIIFKDF